MARPSVGPKPPRVTLPTDLAADRDLGALARGRLAFGQKADALARRAFGDLLLDDRGAGKAALQRGACRWTTAGTASTGVRGLVDVMAVEAKPGFQAQRIARAQADRHAPRVRPAACARRLGRVGRRRDLEAVLAGIAGAADVAARARRSRTKAPVMNVRVATCGASRASTCAACGPCSASRPRANIGSISQAARDASAGARSRRPCRRR